MSNGWTNRRDKIKAQTGAHRKALVVEGPDDKDFVEALLNRIAPGSWELDWVVGVSEGKGRLPDILAAEISWVGLVDRDEYADHQVAALESSLPGRLFVLPRYCMESYFISPAELTAALGNHPVKPGQTSISLSQEIDEARTAWTRHGALWRVVNPLQQGLWEMGFQKDLLSMANAQDDSLISAKLTEWHNFLEPAPLLAKFQELLAEAGQATPQQQLNLWIHGKQFFNEVVVSSLNRIWGQKSAADWLQKLRENIALPADLHFLWRAMNLPIPP